ncbi:MAG: hypothetical protein COA78_23775 [Blastopirellula sp.]|nr:MAG: hypothetical protein COA78_23775 [Blastopirellula sp.]
MPYRFKCSECDFLIGMKIKRAGFTGCPKCGSSQKVPEDLYASDSELNEEEEEELEVAISATDSENPYRSPQHYTSSKTQRTRIEPDKTGLDFVVTYSYECWMKNLPVLILIWAVVIIINLVVITLIRMTFTAAATELLYSNPPLAYLVEIAGSVVYLSVELQLGLGQTAILLQFARNENAVVSDLFQVRKAYFPLLAVYVMGYGLFIGLMIVTISTALLYAEPPYLLIGLAIAFLFPLIVAARVLITYWPVYYLLADEKVSFTQSFQEAKEIGSQNKMVIFRLFVYSLGTLLLGAMFFLVGIVAALPLVALYWVVAYLYYTDQIDNDLLRELKRQ